VKRDDRVSVMPKERKVFIDHAKPFMGEERELP
jgi:hypothetical protein